MSTVSRIRLDPDLTAGHASAFQTYFRGAHNLSRTEWHTLRTGMDMLAQCQVNFQESTYTFAQFYRTFLEGDHAPAFLVSLYQLTNIQQTGAAMQAQHAREILAWLTNNGFYGPNAADSSFLVTYCLYQWASFANGYIFQISVFRDLEASGIRFTPNDPRNLQQRFADHDLVLQGFKGDIKLSLYFLDALPLRSLSADFYLTQMYDRRQTRQRRVALLNTQMWKAINGHTTPGRLLDALQWFPTPVAITLQQEPWIIMAYIEWKAHVLSAQARSVS
ncbi:MAG: hypothetical protein ACOYNY_08810 [Caldilineaceae bacterium]